MALIPVVSVTSGIASLEGSFLWIVLLLEQFKTGNNNNKIDNLTNKI